MYESAHLLKSDMLVWKTLIQQINMIQRILYYLLNFANSGGLKINNEEEEIELSKHFGRNKGFQLN